MSVNKAKYKNFLRQNTVFSAGEKDIRLCNDALTSVLALSYLCLGIVLLEAYRCKLAGV